VRRSPGRAGAKACEGARKEWLAQRAQVEARAADEQGRVAAPLYLVNRAQRVVRPVGGCVVHFRRHEVNQVVRHAAPLCGGDFGRGDLDLAVDLDGVAVDDLAARAQRERDAELALARSRRADDRDDRPRRLTLGAHGEGKRRQKRMTSQMTASRASAPTSCVREKRIGRESPRKLFDNISPVGAERL